MTTQLPKERLKEIEACSWMDDLGLSMAELAAMARALLAAYEQEPAVENLRIADALESLLWPNMALGNKAVIKAAIDALRTHPAPSIPAVPDEMTPRQASRSYCGEVRGYRDGWNACRAAMLNGGKS